MDAVTYYGLISSNKQVPLGTNEVFAGPDYAEYLGSNYLNLRKTTIYGGSNEIQKNILAKMVLGL